jgi:hypothetical protein
MYVVARSRGATKGEAVGVVLIGRWLYRWIFAGRMQQAASASRQDINT